MAKNDIKEAIFQYLYEATDVESGIEEESDLKEQLGLDSIQAVNMVVDLEDKFKIDVDDEEIMELKTVRNVIDLVLKKTAAHPAG